VLANASLETPHLVFWRCQQIDCQQLVDSDYLRKIPGLSSDATPVAELVLVNRIARATQSL
jgi:hypothetical protein